MAQGSTLFIGLDVHKETIAVAYVSEERGAESWKAQVRLCKRYQRLIARGKQVNQVGVAIAREMAAFVWAIAREVAVAH